MESPNKTTSNLVKLYRPRMNNLDDIHDWYLNDEQKQIMLDVYSGAQVEVTEYTETITNLNQLVGQYLIENGWRDPETKEINPTLTFRGNHYVQEYLLK